MHDGAQWLVRIVAVALLAFAILRRGTSQLRPWLDRIVCLAVTTGSVGWIKQATIKAGPGDLQRYGGGSAYVELGDAAVRASGVRPDHCFPGAHSSSAFAFFGLYFLALRYRRAAARRVLALVLLTGLSFAATQWLRGAHFVSHDLWSAAIGWLVAVLALPLLGNRTESDQRSGRYIEPEESSRVV